MSHAPLFCQACGGRVSPHADGPHCVCAACGRVTYRNPAVGVAVVGAGRPAAAGPPRAWTLRRDLSPDGAVVFTAETHAFQPAAYWGAFAVSKSGLGTLAAIWADECEQAGKPRFHVVVPGPVASPQRMQSHPGENRAALPSADAVAVAYLRLLGPEGRALGAAPLTIVT